MNKAESKVNMYACNKATNSSIQLIKSTKGIAAIEAHSVSKINIKDIRLNMMICPAVIFANKRIMSANGFVKIPKNSTTANKGFTATGTPGIQKMCFQ